MPDPQYVDIATSDGSVLRVLYEVTIGDLLVSSLIVVTLVFLLVKAVIRGVWRW